MGLIGWADAPNSIESTDAKPTPQIPLSPQNTTDTQPSTPEEKRPIERLAEALDDAPAEDPDAKASPYETTTAYAEAEPVAEAAMSIETSPHTEETPDPTATSEVNENEGLGNELVTTIRNLKPANATYDDTYDISKFDLHEIKFLFEHAERFGDVDYYGIVREVFAVKHRILDEQFTNDDISSPNLDELMSYVEGKYETFYGGEVE